MGFFLARGRGKEGKDVNRAALGPREGTAKVFIFHLTQGLHRNVVLYQYNLTYPRDFEK